MKFLLTTLLLLAGSWQWLSAATRAEVNVLEATENIRFLSQRITRDYLYLYANPLKIEVQREIERDLESMVANIRTISTTTSDEDTKNILEFLIYSKDQIVDIVGAKPDKEKAALMLDYSETLLEGANNIATLHSYNFSESEKMLMKSKSIAYLLERAAKYYMALGIGLGTEINRKQMGDALERIDETIGVIEAYRYPESMQREQGKLKNFWWVTKSFYTRQRQFFISNLVALSTDELEHVVSRFTLYHRKNQ